MLRRTIVIIASIIGVGLLIALGVIADILRPSAAPSGELVAIPIVETDTSSTEPAEATTEQLAMATETKATEQEEVLSEPVVFELAQEESRVSFTLGEVLRGEPASVIGVTNQVAAQLVVDFKNPAASQMGVVQVNARTLATNIESRNRAIRNKILDVDEFEFISFAPTQLIGLPESVSVGETNSFQIVGDLTIRHITREEIFQATVTIESVSRLSGFATVTIKRADYELTIPSVPQVADVEEDVLLEIDFVALAQ